MTIAPSDVHMQELIIPIKITRLSYQISKIEMEHIVYPGELYDHVKYYCHPAVNDEALSNFATTPDKNNRSLNVDLTTRLGSCRGPDSRDLKTIQSQLY